MELVLSTLGPLPTPSAIRRFTFHHLSMVIGHRIRECIASRRARCGQMGWPMSRLKNTGYYLPYPEAPTPPRGPHLIARAGRSRIDRVVIGQAVPVSFEPFGHCTVHFLVQ